MKYLPLFMLLLPMAAQAFTKDELPDRSKDICKGWRNGDPSVLQGQINPDTFDKMRHAIVDHLDDQWGDKLPEGVDEASIKSMSDKEFLDFFAKFRANLSRLKSEYEVTLSYGVDEVIESTEEIEVVATESLDGYDHEYNVPVNRKIKNHIYFIKKGDEWVFDVDDDVQQIFDMVDENVFIGVPILMDPGS